MIYILMGIAAIEAIAIRYLLNEKEYWKQVAKNNRNTMKKMWYEDKNQWC